MITYPVSPDDRFSFREGIVTTRGMKWPRADLLQLTGAPADLVIMREVIAAAPAFNAATHKISGGTWSDDEADQVATYTPSVVALDSAELADSAAATVRAAKRAAVVSAVSTHRTWSVEAAATTVTSGNAVATLQTVVRRLGTFFDRFADLIEGGDK